MLSISSLSSSVYSWTPDFSSSTSSSSGIVFIASFLMGLLPFHHLQFLSNLPQYSWSYHLSDHPYNFLTVNLPSSSPRWNVPSSHSCHATSSISHQYSLSNSLIASYTFFKFSLPSHVLDSTVNPFQHTKYLSFSLTFLLFSICSTFHSSSPSIITGAGCFFFCPFTYPTYLRILLTLTTGCILTVLGSSNLTAFDDIISLIL